jgi:hypothetical protein
MVKRGDFSACDAPRSGRTKIMTTPEIMDQIHELILEDHRISAKDLSAPCKNFMVRPCSHHMLNIGAWIRML